MSISAQDLLRIAADWIAQGKQLIGPKRVKPGLVLYARLKDASELALDGFLRPANSIKEAVFPRHEVLYRYRVTGGAVELLDEEFAPAETLVLAARPCDAAALPILDPLFNWDYRDEFWNRRRAATTIIALACHTHDEHCFCTSVGLAPDATRGADALLYPLGDAHFAVRQVTAKSEPLVAGYRDEDWPAMPAGPPVKFDPTDVQAFLEANFDSPFWNGVPLRCLGCGACAYHCPTCHCFDIIDEKNARVRNWDACQFALFTLHASGHNPRSTQPERQRQRLQHKFRIYREKFGEILCTGCGNCTRNCPVDLGVLNVLEAMPHG
jgi:ferredoxin